MKSLIEKEFHLHGAYLLRYTVLLVGLMVVFLKFTGNTTFTSLHFTSSLLLVGFIAGSSLMLRMMVAEERNRAMAFLKSLPLSDEEIVLSKFFAAAAFTLLILLIASAGFGLSFAAGLLFYKGSLPLPFLLAVLFSLLFYNSLLIMLGLLVRAEKAMLLSRLLLVLAFFGVFALFFRTGLLLKLGQKSLQSYLLIYSIALLLLTGVLVVLTLFLFKRKKSYI